MSSIDCQTLRAQLRELHEGRLTPEARASATGHLAGCEACRQVDAEERALSELLREKLAMPRAPDALRARLAAQLTPAQLAATSTRPGVRAATRKLLYVRWLAVPMTALAVAAAALLYVRQTSSDTTNPLVREALNDHLRVLYAEHPIEIASGGIHQVKPWFTGKLDFAPYVMLDNDAEFPLQGGALSYFVDRRAATLIFKRRLHTISVFVFRADGLSWPTSGQRALSSTVNAQVSSKDGFHVVLFRYQDLGYALVSDVAEPELLRLGTKLVQP